jgi:hypothetical protein
MSAAPHIEPWVHDFVRLEPHLENALEYAGGTHTAADVYEGVIAGDFQFWPGEESVIITQLVENPRKKVCHYFLAGGNLVELERMAEGVEKWAKEHGCVAATLTGRPGWKKSFLRDQGYEIEGVAMIKEL